MLLTVGSAHFFLNLDILNKTLIVYFFLFQVTVFVLLYNKIKNFEECISVIIYVISTQKSTE